MDSKCFMILVLLYMFQAVLCVTPAFDENLYENVLDSELCSEQLEYITQNNSLLRIKFFDAGPRIPRGIQHFNMKDLGSYYDCIGINEYFNENSTIEGKYCSIGLQFPDLESIREVLGVNSDNFVLDGIEINNEENDVLKRIARIVNGIEDERTSRTANISLSLQAQLAICVPKTCTAAQGFHGLLADVSILGINITENFCRLTNDKPDAPVNYVTIITFALILASTFASTVYDIVYSVILKEDARHINKIYASCSVYTNTRRLLTYKPVPGAIECMDGIRAISMVFVFAGHTVVAAAGISTFINRLEPLDWINSNLSLWVKAAPLAVDSFLFMAGILVVYSTVGKMSARTLIRNLHLFYINRILRLFPLLVITILLQASLFHYISDGPSWASVGSLTQSCRTNWWSTLLYVQNYANNGGLCLPQTWYLAVDMQLYILSPILLFFIFRGRKFGFVSLAILLLLLLATNMVYNFHYGFYAGLFHLTRSAHESRIYMKKYYFNTFTRASPFIVGMMFGYLLHLTKGIKVRISKTMVMLWWLISGLVMCSVVIVHNSLHKTDWDYPILDKFLNTYMRPLWAAALGWLIFSCVHGYSGPLNWFLSLTLWKVPARLSYALYLTHYSVLYIWYSSKLTPVYFSPITLILDFLSQFVITYILSFVLVVLVDAPVSTLVKVLMEGGGKREKKAPVTPPEKSRTETDLENNLRM